MGKAARLTQSNAISMAGPCLLPAANVKGWNQLFWPAILQPSGCSAVMLIPLAGCSEKGQSQLQLCNHASLTLRNQLWGLGRG